MDDERPTIIEGQDEMQQVYNHDDTAHAPLQAKYLAPLVALTLVIALSVATITASNSQKKQTTLTRASENIVKTVCSTGTAGQNGCDYIGTAGLQEAINVAVPNTHISIKDTGTFRIDRTVTIHDKNVTIDAPVMTALFGNDTEDEPLFDISGTSIVIISSLELRSNHKNVAIDIHTNGTNVTFSNMHILSDKTGLLVRSTSHVVLLASRLDDVQNNAILVGETAAIEARNNIFINNKIGVTIQDQATGSITNNVFFKNTQNGVSISSIPTASLLIKNNIFAKNTKEGFLMGANHISTLANNLFFKNNPCATLNQFCTANGSINMPPVTNNYIFVNADGNDFHLIATSPAKDAGDLTIHDPDGTRSDMGAYGGPDACKLDPGLTGCPGVPMPTVTITPTPTSRVNPTVTATPTPIQITPVGVTPTTGVACVPPKFVYCKTNANCCGGVGYKCNSDHQCESTGAAVPPPVKR